jgi:Pentapeptide repeats (8 copies)
MANEEHLVRLQQGVEAWNAWRLTNPRIQLNLSEADLCKADLSGADLMGATLTGANLHMGATLTGANLHGADLREADLREADLMRANLSGADLWGAHLREANLREAYLSGTDLTGADLQGARLLRTNFEGADLTGCLVYGVSAWDLNLVGTKQLNLVITESDEPVITVDNLEVAQFIYLLLHNEKIREVIDRSPPKRCSSWAGLPPTGRLCSMPYGRAYASGTTCPSCLISRSRQVVISRRRSPLWHT